MSDAVRNYLRAIPPPRRDEGWVLYARPADAGPDVGWRRVRALGGTVMAAWAEAVAGAPGDLAPMEVARVVDAGSTISFHGLMRPEGLRPLPFVRSLLPPGPAQSWLGSWHDDWVGAWWGCPSPAWLVGLALAAGVDPARVVLAGTAALRRAGAGTGQRGAGLEAIERWARGSGDYAALTAAHAAFVEAARPSSGDDEVPLWVAVHALFRGAAALPPDAAWDPAPPTERPGGGRGHGSVGQALFTLHDLAPFEGAPAARDPWLAARLRGESAWLRAEQLPLAAVLEAATERSATDAPGGPGGA